jgi:hypothetical protein
MEKRYQVFVSSTFTDLKDARQGVVQALLQMRCLPAGMELFPAADEEQLEFIKRVIDDCDYYVLILGGRYGSLDAEGVAYTEREFDYALEKGIPVLAFPHANPDSLPENQRELEPSAQAKLARFRAKVCKGRMVKEWNTPSDLPTGVTLSLLQTIQTRPRPGWTRSPAQDPTELLAQINDLRLRNEKLAQALRAIEVNQAFRAELAPLNGTFLLTGTYGGTNYAEISWKAEMTWEEMLGVIGPSLLTWTNEDTVSSLLARAALMKTKGSAPYPHKLDDQPLDTVKIQLIALDLIVVQQLPTVMKVPAMFWSVTPKGRAVVLKIRSVKAAPKPITTS